MLVPVRTSFKLIHINLRLNIIHQITDRLFIDSVTIKLYGFPGFQETHFSGYFLVSWFVL